MSAEVVRREAYVRNAVDAECAGLAATVAGRNDRLNRAAFALGQLIGAGAIERHVAESRLFTAAEANGYVAKDGAAAARATIRSGLDRGERQPRQIPEFGQLREGVVKTTPSIIGAKTPITSETSRRREVVDEQHERDLASARRILREARPVAGTPGEAYLHGMRRIDTAAIRDLLERADAIAWHPSVYFNEPGHDHHGKRFGCIIAVMTDPVTARLTGAISRTCIAPDGRKIGKAKTLGRPTGIVRLSPDEDVTEGLYLAEGLETALAAMAIGLRPVWATGSAGLMGKFPVLSGVECLTVIADNDRNGKGQAAAREAATRWRQAGREARILIPLDHGDLNDLARGAAA